MVVDLLTHSELVPLRQQIHGDELGPVVGTAGRTQLAQFDTEDHRVEDAQQLAAPGWRLSNGNWASQSRQSCFSSTPAASLTPFSLPASRNRRIWLCPTSRG